MRTLLLIIILGLTLPRLWGQSIPDLETVVAAFFEQQMLDSRQFYALSFEHRPDGYYVVYKEDGMAVSDRALFYDTTTPNIDYERISSFARYFGENDDPQPSEKKQLVAAYLRQLGRYTTDAFEQQPYYGYDGWYKDVIAYFEEKTTLDNDELHALARAQSVASSSLLSDNRGYTLESDRFELSMGQNSLTDFQVIMYRELADKCLASYRELKQRNPNYLTPVGTAAIKYANEVMDVFLTLLYYQNPETAMDVLEENLYPEHLLMNARNLLQSCPPNAILITYGDNDTYPLYYLQAMGSFRKDVLIANYSLLNISRYRLMFLNEPLWTKPIQTRLLANHFEEEVTYWGKTGTYDTISMEEIYGQLAQAENYYQRVFQLPSPAIAVPVPEDAETLLAAKAPETIIWEAGKNRGFIFPPEIFIGDALTANQWQRPVCFAHTVAPSIMQPWRKHLAREGLVYRGYPETFSGSVTDFRTAAINIDYSLDFWYNRMSFDTITEQTTIDQLSFYTSNLLAGVTLATKLDQLGRSEEAIQFCEFLMDKLPNRIKAWDDNWIYILEVLMNAERDVLAKKLYETLVSNLDKGLIHQEEIDRRNYLKVKLNIVYQK